MHFEILQKALSEFFHPIKEENYSGRNFRMLLKALASNHSCTMLQLRGKVTLKFEKSGSIASIIGVTDVALRYQSDLIQG